MTCDTLLLLCIFCTTAVAFPSPFSRHHVAALHAKNSQVEEYRNAATSVLSNFLQSDDNGRGRSNGVVVDPFESIDFDAPKVRKMPVERLAAILDREIYEKEWFVTGNVNPSYFSKDFQFQDPDVKLSGIEEYARAVYRLFDQTTSRAEIISTSANAANKITVTWRLSGKVKIGPSGLSIKPYICYTDFLIDENGLICFQEDRFGIPGWDIVLSALFPFLIGTLTAAPAPPVEPRIFKELAFLSPLDELLRFFTK